MKTRRRLLILTGLALLLVLAAFVPRGIFRRNLTVGDLVVAKSPIISYSLLDDNKGTYQYVIRLTGYQATFQIAPEFAPYFAKNRFQSDLKAGDSLSVWIPVASTGKLISNGTIPVFAVRTASDTYLDEHSTLDAYNHKNNPKPASAWTSWVPFIAAASIILLICLAYAIWRIARAISARPRKPKTLSDPEALYESSQRLRKVLTNGAPEQKSLAAADAKLLTMGESEQEVIVIDESGESPGKPPHG